MEITNLLNFSLVKMMGAADKQVESLEQVYGAIKIHCNAGCFELGRSTE
jgi:hypothetical protein